MKSQSCCAFIVLALFLGLPARAQGPLNGPHSGPDSLESDPKLPNGKSQRDEILKADHIKSRGDAEQLTKLTGEVKAELDKSEWHVVSVATLKKLDEIEKLTKRIRSRLKRL